MGPIRNIFTNDHFIVSINMNNSEGDKQKLYPSNNTINMQHSTSKPKRIQRTFSDILTNNDDCFMKFGLISSSEEKTSEIQNETEQDQPINLVEEIDAIIALIIYNTYSKKYQSTSSLKNRTKIRDDIDRFDGIYSCLIDQFISSRNNHSKKSNLISDYLRDRFFSLSNINKLKIFQLNEQSRVSEEKKVNFNRVRYIPNILSYQRTCPYYNLNKMKWIRDHLC